MQAHLVCWPYLKFIIMSEGGKRSCQHCDGRSEHTVPVSGRIINMEYEAPHSTRGRTQCVFFSNYVMFCTEELHPSWLSQDTCDEFYIHSMRERCFCLSPSGVVMVKRMTVLYVRLHEGIQGAVFQQLHGAKCEVI